VNAREFVESFERLSLEDQSAVLKEIEERRSGQPKPGCSPGSMKEMAGQLMSRMESSGSPMALCAEMMRLCREEATCSEGGPTTTSQQGEGEELSPGEPVASGL